MHFFKSLLVFSLISLPLYAENAKLDADLAYKAQFGRADDIPILTAQGASPDAKNEAGAPALVVASQRQDGNAESMLKALLEVGANIDAVDQDGRSALHHAAMLGKAKLVELLMEKGANSYVQDKFGNYAAGLAFQAGQKEVYQYITDFVEKQRVERAESYKKYNETIEKQYADVKKQLEQYNEKLIQRQEDIRQGNAEKRSQKEIEQQEQERSALEAQLERKRLEKEAAAEKAKKLAESYRSEGFKNDIRALAVKACGFQYWSYCKKVRVKTEYTPQQLDGVIDAHAQAVEQMSAQMKEQYALKEDYVQGISKLAQQTVFRVLKEYGSNATLASNGVGTKADAQQRCHEVAEDLNLGGISYYEEVPEKKEKSVHSGGGMSGAPRGTSGASPAPSLGRAMKP